ncbi:hypothetical protein [Mesorhizobium muleiense]|jgi:hypothetical protein|uniref:hypothetical protein n=1 Tax=Mesorhizobium muleiense TaxID=1004279 RepID=UPI001F462728|nr:hypothetical protein [Mesorhizobium muleiense]MCF6110733.1 hypothetical protein [Mesorhizobium muleiense]
MAKDNRSAPSWSAAEFFATSIVFQVENCGNGFVDGRCSQKVKDPGMGWIVGRIVRKNSEMQRLLRIEWNAAP